MTLLVCAELEKWITEELKICAQAYADNTDSRPYLDGRHDQLIKLRDAIKLRLFSPLFAAIHSGTFTAQADGGLLPKPTKGLLVSMAMRANHGFGLLSDRKKEYYIREARMAWEEISGSGFYGPEREAEYAAMWPATTENPNTNLSVEPSPEVKP